MQKEGKREGEKRRIREILQVLKGKEVKGKGKIQDEKGK